MAILRHLVLFATRAQKRRRKRHYLNVEQNPVCQ